MRVSRSQGMQQHRRCSWAPGKPVEHIATGRGGESTGIGVKGSEPRGESLGELMKGFAYSASRAAETKSSPVKICNNAVKTAVEWKTLRTNCRTLTPPPSLRNH